MPDLLPAPVDKEEEEEEVSPEEKVLQDFLKGVRQEVERSLGGKKHFRETQRRHVDDPRGRDAAQELKNMRELKLRGLQDWVAPTQKGERVALRSPMLTRAAHEASGVAEEQRRKAAAIQSGETPVEGEGIALPVTRAVKRFANLEFLFDLVAPDKDASKEMAKGTRVGMGSMVGLQKGLEAQKFLPHPIAKAAAPLIGTVGGGVVGYLMGGETPTKGEVAELGVYGTGYGSVLTQVTKLGWLPRIGIGGVESAAIGMLARQSKSVLDTGELGPYDPQSLLFEAGMGAALGPFMKMRDVGGPTYKNFSKKNKDTIQIYKDRIALLKGKLGYGPKRASGQPKYGSKFKTPQARKEGMKSLQIFQKDLDIINQHPEVYWGKGADPARTARMLALIYQENPHYRGRGPKWKNSRERDESFILGASGEGKGKESYQLNIDMLHLRDVELLEPATWKELLREAGSVMSRSDRPRKGKIGTLLSAISGGNFKRLYMGAADVIHEAARKSGAGPDNYGFKLSAALRNAVVDGDRYAAFLNKAATKNAKAFGFNTLGKRKESSLAKREFEEYQRLRHSSDGGVRGEGDLSVKSGTDPNRGDVLHTGGPRRMEPDHLSEGTVAENLRIARSREAYHGYSEMGKSLIDGFDDAAKQVAKRMKEENVIVMGPNGVTRLAKVDQKYFPRHLKHRYERALRNSDKLNRKGERVYQKDLDEMAEILGTEKMEALDFQFKDLRGSNAVSDPYSMTGELFSHLERARIAGDIDPRLLDFSYDLSAGYLQRAGQRLGEIENFGQMYTVANKKAGIGQVNPDYIFKRADNINDQSTKDYIELLHTGIFGQKSGSYDSFNRFLTGTMIANPFSALKNLTGLFKTGTVVSNKTMVQAMGRQLADSVQDIAWSIRGVDKVSKNTALSETIGIIRKDTGSLTQMLDSEQMGSLSKGGTVGKPLKEWLRPHLQDKTGTLLNISGFTPAEHFVRKQALQAFQIERANFLRLYDEAPEVADRIAMLLRKLEYNPDNAGLRAELRKMTGAGIKSGAEAVSEVMMGNKSRFSRKEMSRNRKLAEHMRFMTKLDIDPTKMANERFKEVVKGQRNRVELSHGNAPETVRYGEETMRFLQKSVNEVQGGYRYDQLPVFMNDPRTKILLKFMQWSQQMQRHFDRNIIAEASEGNVKPLMKYLAGTQIAGESMRGVSTFFGREYDDASYAEIGSVLKEGHMGESAKLLLIRAAMNAFIGGQWDLLGDMVGGRAVRKMQTGRHDRLGFPMLDQFNLLSDAFNRRFNEGGDDKRLAKDLGRLVSLTHRGGQLATEMGVFGADAKELSDYKSASRKMSGIRKRWVEAPPGMGGMGKKPHISPDRIPLPKGFAFKRDLREALTLGDSEKAKAMVNDYILETIKTDEDSIAGHYKEFKDKVEDSVAQSAPIYTAKENMPRLIAFMQRRDPALAEEMMGYQERYLKTAEDAGLYTPDKKPGALENLKAKAKRNNEWLDAYALLFYGNNRKKGISDADMLKKLDKRILSDQISQVPQIQPKTEAEFGQIREATIPPTDRRIKAGEPDAVPFSRRHAGTYLGNQWGERLKTKVASEISKGRKDAALSEVLIDPRFLEIQSPTLRAEFIEGEWDKRGLSNKKKDELIDKLSVLHLTDQFVLPSGQLWKAWRLERKTWDARLLKQEIREREKK